MSDVNDLHHKAMDLAELALIERLKGNSGESSTLFRKALDFELAAISELDGEIEPTFSVLHRSAGTMALHCGEIRLAEQIAAKALSREPPEEIAEETPRRSGASELSKTLELERNRLGRGRIAGEFVWPRRILGASRGGH